MTVINTNPQVWILTQAGINRITEVMEAPSTERLYVTKIKVGNASYYTPSLSDTDLKSPIEGGSFNVTEKSIDGTTVTFKTIIPETSGGYNITEIGLYETINNVDTCIALGTCEPIVKPAYDLAEDYGYAMSIDYKLNINSVNLSSIYDQIILEPENEYVKKEELEALARTVLFVEGNLMDQISNNTHILGLNRAQQLSELIDETQQAFSNSALSGIYLNLANNVSATSIRGLWGFNYTEKFDLLTSVKDFSIYGNNFGLNKQITYFDSGVLGIAPYLNFTTSDYYKANYNANLKINTNKFTVAFLGSTNANSTKKTILAQADPNSNIYNWIVSINANNAIEVQIFTDKDNYKTYVTANNTALKSPLIVVVTYDGTDVKVFINGLSYNTTVTSVGLFTTLGTNNLPTTSYTLSSNGIPENMINSKVSLLSLLDVNLSDQVARALSLSLKALSGINIYRGV